MRRVPSWAYLIFGVVAVAGGVLGVTHAPPAIAKVVWSLVIVVGVVSLGYGIRTRRSAPTNS